MLTSVASRRVYVAVVVFAIIGMLFHVQPAQSQSAIPAYRTVDRVSVSTSGAQSDALIDGTPFGVLGGGSAFAENGQVVVFTSAATTLVGGDTNEDVDVFVRNRATGTTSRVSVATDGKQANNDSVAAGVSADGRYVLFTSLASNLVAPDTDFTPDIFLHDRNTGQTVRVPTAIGDVSLSLTSLWVALSGNGRFVAYWAQSTGFPTTNLGLYVYDRTTGQSELASPTTDGQPLDGLPVGTVSLSTDGRYVAFNSTASNLVSGDTNQAEDVFVRDRVAGVTTRVSLTNSGTQSSGIPYNFGLTTFISGPVSISDDGRYVVFESLAPDLVANDTNGLPDVFVRDRTANTTRRVSVTSSGGQANGGSQIGRISGNGRYVMFISLASNLVNGVHSGVYVHDLLTGQTGSASVASDGSQGNINGAVGFDISDDGRFILFSSPASNLLNGDTNNVTDFFIAERLSLPSAPVQVAPEGVFTTSNLQPTYTWQPVSGATAYFLTIYDLSTSANIHLEGISASVCTPALCSYRPTTLGATLTNGKPYGWYVASYNEAGPGTWSAGKAFTIFIAPTAPSLIAPTGSIATGTPTYRWSRNALSELQYGLYVYNSSNQIVFQQTINSPASACNATECQVTQSPALPVGNYTWYLASANPAGASPFASLSFSVISSSAPSNAPTFVP